MGTRCDACWIADAKARALKGRSVLYFCGHHARQYMAALNSQGWVMQCKRKAVKK